MSTFGDGTFKQAIYEEIQWRMKCGAIYTAQAVQDILEIASYLLGGMGDDEPEVKEALGIESVDVFV